MQATCFTVLYKLNPTLEFYIWILFFCRSNRKCIVVCSREEARGHCERAAYVTLPTIMANQPQVKVLRFHNEEELGAWVTAHEILLHAEAQAAQDEQCRQSLEFLLKAHAISV